MEYEFTAGGRDGFEKRVQSGLPICEICGTTVAFGCMMHECDAEDAPNFLKKLVHRYCHENTCDEDVERPADENPIDSYMFLRTKCMARYRSNGSKSKTERSFDNTENCRTVRGAKVIDFRSEILENGEFRGLEAVRLGKRGSTVADSFLETEVCEHVQLCIVNGTKFRKDGALEIWIPSRRKYQPKVGSESGNPSKFCLGGDVITGSMAALIEKKLKVIFDFVPGGGYVKIKNK